MKIARIVTLTSFLAAGAALAQAPLDTAALAAARFAPAVKVVDTVSSLGPLATVPQPVTLADLVRYHGHPCDGLVVAAAGIAAGLERLFPGGVVDRTDLVAAANASPCYGDAAAYLTGARARYGTLVVDSSLGDVWILHRRSNGATVRVSLRPGIKPAELPGLEGELRSRGCDRPLMARVAALQDELIRRVLATDPAAVFEVAALPAFPYPVAAPRADTLKAGCGPATPRK